MSGKSAYESVDITLNTPDLPVNLALATAGYFYSLWSLSASHIRQTHFLVVFSPSVWKLSKTFYEYLFHFGENKGPAPEDDIKKCEWQALHTKRIK